VKKLKGKLSPIVHSKYNFSDEVFIPGRGNNEGKPSSPFLVANNSGREILNTLQNENESLKIDDLSNDNEQPGKKVSKNKLNGKLYKNAEVFDNIRETQEETHLPSRDIEQKISERENQSKRELEIINSKTRNTKKFSDNKNIRKDFQTVNQEVEEFMKRYKTQKEKSQERNAKIKCMVRSKSKDRSYDKQLSQISQPSKINQNRKSISSQMQGEYEETKNLNEELNKILHRLNSGSQISSTDSHNLAKANRERNESEKYEENNINKLYEIWNKKKQIANDLNRCSNSIMDKKKIIKILEDENRKDPLLSSYSYYTERSNNQSPPKNDNKYSYIKGSEHESIDSDVIRKLKV